MACLGFMKKVIKQSTTFANEIDSQFNTSWLTVSRTDLETADGRKRNAPDYTKNGSFLYIAYENNHVLYIGETSVSVKSRFFGDGSGAHKTKEWYKRVTHINYIKATHEELPKKFRKLLEQALSIVLEPEFYG